jgi:hypothetical protein
VKLAEKKTRPTFWGIPLLATLLRNAADGYLVDTRFDIALLIIFCYITLFNQMPTTSLTVWPGEVLSKW